MKTGFTEFKSLHRIFPHRHDILVDMPTCISGAFSGVFQKIFIKRSSEILKSLISQRPPRENCSSKL